MITDDVQAAAQTLRAGGLVAMPTETVYGLAADAANRAAERLGIATRIAPAEIDNRDGYVGPGYGRSSEASLEALRLAARTDALLLDPVYTSKAMAGLIDAVRRGELTRDDTVIFLHTGGLPAAFAWRDDILRASGAESLLHGAPPPGRA